MKRSLAFALTLIFYGSILPPLSQVHAAPVIIDGGNIKDNTVTREAITWTSPTYPSVDCTITSAGGHVGHPLDNAYKLSAPYVDVRTKGLACDNTTDDAAALATMLSSLASGSTALVKGMCALGSASWAGLSVTSKNNIRFVGADESSGFRVLVVPSQTIQTGGGGNPVLWLWADSSNVTFANLTFDGSGTTQEVFIGLDNVSSPKFHRNRFLNTVTNLSTATPAIQGNGTTDMDVMFNTFDTLQFGAASGGGNAPSVDTGTNRRSRFVGNTFKNIDRDGIIMGADDQEASNNTFIDIPNGAGIITTAHWVDNVLRGPKNTTITGNTFKNNSWHGIQSDIVGGGVTDGITVSGNTFDNVGYTGGGNAFYMLNVRGGIFSNNTVRGGATPVTVSNGDNIVISGNTFSGFSSVGINLPGDTTSYVRNITIGSNILYSAAEGSIGIAASNNSSRVDNVIIFSNQVNTYGRSITAYDNVFNLMIHNNILAPAVVSNQSILLQDTQYSTYGAGNIIGTGTIVGVLLEAFGNGNRRGYGTAAPTTGTWKVGDLWYNTAADNVILRKCTTTGTPGTWDNLVAAF